MDLPPQPDPNAPPTLDYMSPVQAVRAILPVSARLARAGYWSFVAFAIAWGLLCGGVFRTTSGPGPVAVVLLIVLALLAITTLSFGIAARRKATDPPMRSRASSVIVLAVLELVVLTVAVVKHVDPNRVPVRERANRVKCSSNLSQIGKALLLYSQDHKAYPPQLDALLLEEEMSAEVFICPSSADERAPGTQPSEIARNVVAKKGHLSYVYVGANLSPQNQDPTLVLAYEPLKNHADKGANFLFADGHTEWLDAAKAKYLISELQAGHNPPRARGGSATRE